MNNKKKKKIKYILIILLLSILFFILFNIQNEENISKEKILETSFENERQKISKETNQKINKQSEAKQETEKYNQEQQSTLNEQIVEKEYIEKEYKGYKVTAKLNIPKINLETNVLEKYSKEALLTSVTKFYGGNPNEIGNFCIAGHNYGNENMFQNIKKLSINDEIYLTDTTGNKVKYIIYEIYTVLPNETKCLSQKTNGNIELTLITCTTDSEKRIIVKAKAE